MPFGCGQCLPCRINRRRLWAHRIILESTQHAENSFVTLTYAADTYPEGGSLDPAHAKRWLHRLRRAVRPLRFRYFLVGEYGEETQRAHYHAAMFGLGMQFQSAFIHTWQKGFVHVGELNHDTAGYIAGYVTKKLTAHADPRLNGRHPEFARMSLRPGIGARAMSDVAKTLNDSIGADLVNRTGDVPGVLHHGRKKLPLGRYLTQKLRDEMGVTEPKSLERYKEEMQALRATSTYRLHSQDPGPAVDWEKINQVLKRHKIWRKKETI